MIYISFSTLLIILFQTYYQTIKYKSTYSMLDKSDLLFGAVYWVLPVVDKNIKIIRQFKITKGFITKFYLLYDNQVRQTMIAVTISKGITLFVYTLIMGSIIAIYKNNYDFVAFTILISLLAATAPLYQIHRDHQAKVQSTIKELPNFLQQIALLLQAGIPLEHSIGQVYASLEPQNGMANLLKYVFLEAEKGVSLLQAFNVLPDLMNHHAINQLSQLLSQLSKVGTHQLSEQLLGLSEELSKDHFLNIKTKAEQLSTKLLLPLMLSMITIMIILVYPVLLQL